MIKRFVIMTFMVVSSIVVGQRSSISPYSIYGFGQNKPSQTVVQSSMGGIGVASQEFNRLNFINPAAAASIRVATYGIAGESTFLNIEGQNQSESNHITSLQYVALGFPLGKKAGFSAGLQPISSVGYKFNNSQYEEDVLTKISRFTGSGGVNKLFGSVGVFLFEGFSLGIEGSFLFGSINRSVVESNVNSLLSSKYEEDSPVRGAQIVAGIQYKKDLSNKIQLSTGFSIKLLDRVKQLGTEGLYSVKYSKGSFLQQNSVEIPVDTAYHKSVDKLFKRPIATNVGLGLGQNGKWYVGLNSTFEKAENLPTDNTFRYKDKIRASLGGYYIPKLNSISSYWNRVVYRAGVRYGNTGLELKGNNNQYDSFTSIKDFGINVGLGLPLPKQLSNLNIGLEYGQRGTTNNNLIKESYWNVRLSLSLNSLNWFKKRRID